MKERGMIFNAEMVRAVLEDRKTQTRRIIKLDHERGMKNPVVRGKSGEASYVGCRLAATLCPFGAVGDRLWVRESYRMPESLDHYSPQQVAEMALGSGYSKPWAPIQLEADGVRTGKWSGFNTPPMTTEPGKLRPSIHMPRWASRITLEITGVRVERLASISPDDARAEGYPVKRDSDGGHLDPWLWFRDLWDGIYPEHSFKANPWVWVIEFKRVEGNA